MAVKNLWGELPKGEEAGISPKMILQEQAKLLSERSGGDLLGTVLTSTRAEYGNITHELVIVAPYLNNYQCSIVSVSHGALTYPVTVYALATGTEKVAECPTEQAFVSVLEKVLTSQKVRSIISSIRSQSPNRPAPPTGLRVQ